MGCLGVLASRHSPRWMAAIAARPLGEFKQMILSRPDLVRRSAVNNIPCLTARLSAANRDVRAFSGLLVRDWINSSFSSSPLISR